MKIGVIGSMQYTEKMMQVRDDLTKLKHYAYMTSLAEPFVGKSDKEKERIKIEQKNNQDAIREFWRVMQNGEAVIVVNIEKHGIKNYIGGNTFLEMGFAHVLDQKIFLLNPIPDMIFTTEIVAMKPIVINGDLKMIK